MALARDPGVRFGILHEDEAGEFPERDAVCAALAARFLAERWRAGLPGMALIVCGDSADCAARLRARIESLGRAWRAGESFGEWLRGCRFFPALADCLVARSGAEEAARLCEAANYRDAMIHLPSPTASGRFRRTRRFARSSRWRTRARRSSSSTTSPRRSRASTVCSTRGCSPSPRRAACAATPRWRNA